jgi:hypothetical protein
MSWSSSISSTWGEASAAVTTVPSIAIGEGATLTCGRDTAYATCDAAAEATEDEVVGSLFVFFSAGEDKGRREGDTKDDRQMRQYR